MNDGSLKRTKVSKRTGEIPSRLWKELQVDEAFLYRMI
jgi:hypothetical protein